MKSGFKSSTIGAISTLIVIFLKILIATIEVDALVLLKEGYLKLVFDALAVDEDSRFVDL